MRWGLILSNPSRRSLAKAPKSDVESINDAFEQMCQDPFYGDIQLLRGSKRVIRRRVGTWRVLYRLDHDHHVIVVVNIKRRGSHTY